MTARAGSHTSAQRCELRLQRAAPRSCIRALLLLACGEAPQSTSPPPFAELREQVPAVAVAPAAARMEEVASGRPEPEALPSEGTPAQVELIPGRPAAPVETEPIPPASEPAQPEPDAPAEDLMPAGLPIAPIGQPGYPEGSAPRLTPLEFVGAITGQPVLFNIYLPPGYDSGSAAYPVLYDLHGLTDSRDTNPGPVVGSLEAAMRAKRIGPLIVVFPQGFSEGYWADSRDGARPSETQVMDELIPYVDGNFRTLPHRARRGVSGFSMGGFGALAYAVKYPERFSVGIGYDSALDTWQTLLGRRANIAAAAFGNDESYFDQISPWANAEENAALLSASSRLRGVSGAQYRDFNAAFRDHVARLGIPYDYVETDCEHYYGCPLDREGQNSWLLVQSAFSQPASDGQP